MDIQLDQIQNMIYVIRSQKVLLDSDLAKLYQLETSALNRQVKRNIERFPKDFMFELNREEFDSLKCQNGISKKGRGYGAKLLTHCMNQFDGKSIELTVKESNFSAIKLYEKLGFIRVNMVHNYYEDIAGIVFKFN